MPTPTSKIIEEMQLRNSVLDQVIQKRYTFLSTPLGSDSFFQKLVENVSNSEYDKYDAFPIPKKEKYSRFVYTNEYNSTANEIKLKTEINKEYFKFASEAMADKLDNEIRRKIISGNWEVGISMNENEKIDREKIMLKDENNYLKNELRRRNSTIESLEQELTELKMQKFNDERLIISIGTRRLKV